MKTNDSLLTELRPSAAEDSAVARVDSESVQTEESRASEELGRQLREATQGGDDDEQIDQKEEERDEQVSPKA